MAFSETQKIDNKGLRILVIIVSIIPLFIVVPALIENPNQEAINSLVILVLILFLSYILVFNSKAEVRIDSQGIHYKYTPFIWNMKVVKWTEIESIEIKTIDPLSDYGGWGYKLGLKKKGLILSGNRAIEMVRKNNKKFAITIKNEASAQREIDKYFAKEPM